MDTKSRRTAGLLFLTLVSVVACSDSGDKADEARLQGLRTVIYATPDLDRSKQWYAEALGVAPYLDESFYVGFNVGGYELGLDPSRPVAKPAGAGAMVYWGVDDVEKELNRLLSLGAKPHMPFQDVGGGIKLGSVLDPFGNAIGLIFNPHFEADD